MRNHRPAGARPDPAGQYANPYTYGGDPVNYVDPAGLWSMGLGIVIGWDKSNGWSVGVGAAADVGGSKGSSYNTSYTWNQDGSNSFSLGASGSVQLAYFPIAMNFGGGYSYNSYSGHTLGVDGSACVGTKDGDDYAACAGVEAGGSEYWDGYGNYLGATAYAGAFAEFKGSEDNSLKVSSGYEAGFLGMEGRGTYAGFSAGADGGSLYAQWSENGGWNYGFGQSFEAWKYEKLNDGSYQWSALEGLLWGGMMTLDVDASYTNDARVAIWAKYFRDNDPDTFEFMSHADEGGFYLNNPDNSDMYDMLPQDFVDRLKSDFHYRNEKEIWIIACEFGKGTGAQYVANKTGVRVRAATGRVQAKVNSYFGIKYTQLKVIDGGRWKEFYPQNGLQK